MDFASLNLLAIVLAAISSMVVAFIWYAPPVFGKLWLEVSGMEDPGMEPLTVVKGFVNSVFIAAVFAVLYQMVGVTTFMDALPYMLLMWGVIISSQAAAVIWGGMAIKLFFVEIGFYLVSYLAIAEVLMWFA